MSRIGNVLFNGFILWTFCSHFQKNHFVRSQVYRKALIRSALGSTDPRASNSGPNVEIQPLGANLQSFEVGGFHKIENYLSKISSENSELFDAPRLQT